MKLSGRATCNHNNFWVIFEKMASKREIIGFQSMSILAIGSNRRQETVSVP